MSSALVLRVTETPLSCWSPEDRGKERKKGKPSHPSPLLFLPYPLSSLVSSPFLSSLLSPRPRSVQSDNWGALVKQTHARVDCVYVWERRDRWWIEGWRKCLGECCRCKRGVSVCVCVCVWCVWCVWGVIAERIEGGCLETCVCVCFWRLHRDVLITFGDPHQR